MSFRKAAPFLLSPAGKDYLWGGNRLKTDYHKNINLDPLAETWECSTHKDGLCTVASGEFQGRTLRDVLIEHPEFTGTHPKMLEPGDLPVLIKLIDAKKDLSVQVHPDDLYAYTHENGQRGKTEMWYVLFAEPGAQLIYGFQREIDKDILSESIREGTIEKYLNYVPVQKDDVFFITPGTVHAIGKGIIIAEIQESSNLTYRLYDYNRRDKNGNLRELHIDKAMDILNFKGSSDPRQPMRQFMFHPGYAAELLGRCRYFQTERIVYHSECIRVSSDSSSFEVLLNVEGEGILTYEESSLSFHKGDCIFVPADSADIFLRGTGSMLRISCRESDKVGIITNQK